MNFTIGLSGLHVAQRTIEIIGTNLANVSTEGYHRQDVVISPLATDRMRGVPIGGAEIYRYSRSIDMLLEGEVLAQTPQLAQVAQELASLQALQGAFGTLDSENLMAAMNRFFGAMRELATDPINRALREQAVWAADGLASQFRNLGAFVQDLEEQVVLEAHNLVDRVNGLAAQIADLNREVEIVLMRGGNANLAIDQRDQAILELAELVQVNVVRRRDDSGTVDVVAWGTPLVTKDRATTLVVGLTISGELGLGVEGGLNYDQSIRGGKLGGLVTLKNDLLSQAREDLDGLAVAVIQEVNRLHVQGVGTFGSFSELTGSRINNPAVTLNRWDAPVSSGTLQLRIVAPDGTAVRHTVYVDAANDTLQTIVAALNAVDPAHLLASVADQRIHLEGRAGYKFDFIQAASLEVGTAWTGTSSPTASGTYAGAQNETYTFKALGDGTVGVTAGLAVEVRNAAGAVVATLDVGDTYLPDTALTVAGGLEMAFAAGTLTGGEKFTVEAVAKPAPEFRVSTPWNGTSAMELSGVYTGRATDTYTFTVRGSGEVGVTDGLALEVRNGAGELVRTLNVGRGYAAGDVREVDGGLFLSFGRGVLADGEQFAVEAVADSDPTGFLAAAGLNTFFEGTRAMEMTVRPEILADPRRLATAQGAEMSDNTLARSMAALGEAKLDALGGGSPTDAFRLLVAGTGQKVAIRQARCDALQTVMRQLENQRDNVSGVDVNEEAAKLMVFERMFQAMARVLNTQQKAMQVLIDLL